MRSAVEIGRAAEAAAAAWLRSGGFAVLDRNWRTRWCELDIVAGRRGVIHIVEVKYRRRPDFGTGFECITAEKAARLRRAAIMWLKAHGYLGKPHQIDIIAVSGGMASWNVSHLPNAIMTD